MGDLFDPLSGEVELLTKSGCSCAFTESDYT